MNSPEGFPAHGHDEVSDDNAGGVREPRAHRIAVIPGDGIGPEVTAEAVKVLEAVGVPLHMTSFDLGAERYLVDGTIVNEEILEEIRGFDAILFGAVGHPDVRPGVIERGLLLEMRFQYDLYINLRPMIGGPRSLDFIVIRENTEGAYAGDGGLIHAGTRNEIALQGSVNTRPAIERCVRFSFELARTRERRSLTLVHKTNILQYAGDLWSRVFNELAEEYPDVETSYEHADAACIYFVQSPQRYDVVVTDNLFGDLLTDLGAAITGGIGGSASGNINPKRTTPSLFEPIHGSAPDIAGKGIADPRGAILSAALMLDHLGEAACASSVRAAVQTSPQVGGSTVEIGDAIVQALAGGSA